MICQFRFVSIGCIHDTDQANNADDPAAPVAGPARAASSVNGFRECDDRP